MTRVGLGIVGGLLWALALVPGRVEGQSVGLPGPSPVAPAADLPETWASVAIPTAPPARGYAQDIAQAKLQAAALISVAPGVVQEDVGGLTHSGPAAPSLVTSFSGISYTGFFPPDPNLAAGQSSLVLVTNGSITIKSKSGSTVASASLSSFFSAILTSTESPFDPKVVYDTGSGRFFVAAVARVRNTSCTTSGVNRCIAHFFLAVSKSSNPTTTGSSSWFFYSFDTILDGSTATTNWADYTGLGVDGSAAVLTANMFSMSTDTFQYTKIRILDKSALVSGAAVSFTDFVRVTDPTTGGQAFTLQPALTFGSPGTFFLASSANSSTSCAINVFGISNSLSSPSLTSRSVSASGSCTVPPDATQAGGGTLLDTGDKRLMNLIYRTGSLWSAHAIASGSVSAVRWMQINVTGWPNTPSFTQNATFTASGVHYFYPTVAVDTSDNLAVVMARSSATEFASAYYTAQLNTDARNTLQPAAVLKAGSANQNLIDSVGRNRYGDYLGAAVDPADGSIWIFGEYVVSSTAWGTWVGNFSLGGGRVAPDGYDFTGSGRGDVAIHDKRTGDWYVGVSTGSAFRVERWVANFGNRGADVEEVLVGDFTGDGKADVAIHDKRTGDWYVGVSTGNAFRVEGWVARFGNRGDEVEEVLAGRRSAGNGTLAGDDRSIPITIAGTPFSDGRSTVSYTLGSSDPRPSCGGTPTGHNVWYTFTSATSGIASISTQGSNYDTVLSIYAAATLTEIGCSDDVLGSRTSRLDLGLSSNTRYLIQVSSFGSSSGGSLSFSFSFAGGP